MIARKKTLIALLSAAILTACGGGGGNEGTKENEPLQLLSATTQTDGSVVRLSFDGGLISSTLPVPTLLTVTANGSNVPVTSITANGSAVDLVLSSKIQSGQVVLASYAAPAFDLGPNNAAIQNLQGVDAAAFSSAVVTNTVASLPAVKINNAVATPNNDGEYLVTGPTRVTVEDSRLGRSSAQTVNANGTNATTSTTIHTISNSKYDVTINSGPVGGLTTISLGGTNTSPLLIIKLRWQ